jgi:hypothetical protein
MQKMKRYTFIFVIIFSLAAILAGCGAKKENLTLDKKNTPLPEYVLNSSDKVKQTYLMAAKYPKVLSSVPCYCGCVTDGHMSNLSCFVQKMGTNNAVKAWDQHGIGCDICVDIANDAVQMHESGKSPKEIYRMIKEKYSDSGDPTPTPEPK